MLNIILTVIATALLLAGCAPASGPGPAPTAKPPATAETKPPAPEQAPDGGVPVLMYHKIGDEKGNDAVIAKERFAEQMAFIQKNGYNPVSLDQLHAYLDGKAGLPSKPVVITFDDGYRDTYEIAMPILRQYGFKSTLFVLTADIEQRYSWQELKEMKAAGMEIASHSYTHRELGTLSPAQQAEEIAKSKAILDKNLNQDTRHFCYPNGSFNEETIRLLKEKGFITAVTINPGWTKRGDNLYAISRVWVGNAVDLKHFEERLSRPDYSIL